MNKTGKLPLMRRSVESRGGSPRKTFSQTPREQVRPCKEHPIKFLRPSKEERGGSMDSYAGSVGNSAKLEFYETYINLPQFSQRNQHERLEDSPNLAYLGAVQRQHLKPNPFGIVRRKGPEASIDIHQYSMGDAYATAFSEGIKHLRNVNTLNLKANRLTDFGASQILRTLESKQVKRVILSENRISLQTVEALSSLIKSQEARLKVLELESTMINDKALMSLCRVLSEDKKLARLSLAKNNLTAMAVPALVELLKYNSTLKYLDLHWNSLGIGGCVELMKGLAGNDGLVHIDLSYNSLGRRDGLVTAKALADMFSVNQFLQHVDISNNYLSAKECEVIGEGLKDNHTIVGIHVQGNDCVVDSKGYIVPVENLNKTDVGHLHRRLLDTPRYKVKNYSRLNCWICENWVEVKLDWKPSSGSLSGQVFIHLECDSFKPVPLSNKSSDYFSVTRMVPPGLLKFFYSDADTITTSNDYNTHILESPIRLEYPSSDGTKNYIGVMKTNVLFIEGSPWDPSEPPSVKPRNDPRIKERTELMLLRVEWKIETSSFKDFQFDTPQHLSDCADYDYQVSNLKDLLSTQKDKDEVLAILKSNYRHITEAFRQLSAISGIELFSISKNVLAEFMKKCKFDNEETVLQEIGILWNLSNAPQSKGEKYNAGNGLCRYEFSEFLVRLAHTLFVKTGKMASLKEAFHKLMEEYVINGIKIYDQSLWHNEKYLTEDVDLFFKLHRPVLEAIFLKYSALGKGPTDRLNLHEFRLMCTEAGLCNDNFVMREIEMCFRQAMMTEVDEILRSEHLQMVYVEFIEALARIAEQIYVDRPGKVLTLKQKLEGMYGNLKNVCPQRVISSFEPPTDAHYHNMKYTRKLVTIQEYIEGK